MKRIRPMVGVVAILTLTPVLLLGTVLVSCTDLGAWDRLLAITAVNPWFDVAWQKRIKLTFLNDNQNEDLLDFPVLVVLDPSKIDYSNFKSDGGDVRFVSPGDPARPLPYEIENWISGGTSYIWVGIPKISGGSDSDYIWLYFGNPNAASEENPSAVWDERYVGVWHLNGACTDASRYTNLGTDSNTVGDITGPVAGAGDFNGFNSHIEIADSSSLDISGSFTLEAWIWKRDYEDRIIVSKYDKGVGARSYDLGFDRSGHYGRSYVTVSSDGGLHDGGILELTYESRIANNAWHHVAGVYDNSDPLDVKLYMFLDGILDSAKTSDQPSVHLSDETVLIGAMWEDAAMYGFWNGRLDEVRISDTPRPASWLAAQYLSMTDSFISFGSMDSYRLHQ